MAKNVIGSQRRRISVLSRKLRNVAKQVNTLKDLVTHLRKNDYISDDVMTEAMVCILKIGEKQNDE